VIIADDSIGSAFSAKRQATGEPAILNNVKETESTEADEVERDSVDGISEEEIEFSNAFNALRDIKRTEASPKKKPKKTSKLPLIV